MATNQNSASSSLLRGKRQSPTTGRKGQLSAPEGWFAYLLKTKERELRVERERLEETLADNTRLREQLAAANARAELAEIDTLTGLPNRRAFDRAMRTTINHFLHNTTQHPWVIAFFDLDNFKRINDTYGHGVGDQVLQKFGQKITAELREGDTLYRIGGEEFVLLTQTNDPHQFMDKIHKLQRKFDAHTPEVTDQTRFSVGFATLSLEFLNRRYQGMPITQISPKDLEIGLMETTDQMMYQDKGVTRGWLRAMIKGASSREAEAEAVIKHYEGRPLTPPLGPFTPHSPA